MGLRLKYFAIGFLAGMFVSMAVRILLSKHVGSELILWGISCGALAVAFAERRGKVKPMELNRRLTLFPPKR